MNFYDFENVIEASERVGGDRDVPSQSSLGVIGRENQKRGGRECLILYGFGNFKFVFLTFEFFWTTQYS